jgi:hypothetical protein
MRERFFGMLIGALLSGIIVLGLRFKIPLASPAELILFVFGAAIVFNDIRLLVTGKWDETVKTIPHYPMLWGTGIGIYFVLGVALPKGWI